MKLEVLPAQKGDCLLLHAGEEGEPGLILIDGGPAGVSSDTLIPRLEALREERGLDEGDPLVIDLVVVSHVDDDHINGIIDLFESIKERRDSRQPPLFKVEALWHNSFDRILGNDETGDLLGSGAQFGAASFGDAASLFDEEEEEEEESATIDHAKILASVKQGDDLKRLAADLDIPVNGPFGGRLIQTLPGQVVSRTIAGIEFVVVGPRHDELLELQKQFDEWLEKQPFAERSPSSLLAALDDESAANLSSIVLLARKDGQTILLTGDARSDKILDGLADNGLFGAGGTIEVGILKMPHHGSIRNLDDEGDFFRRVTSRHYVFSGNGEHSNPDRETFDLLLKTRPGAEMNLYLTYPMAEIDPERRRIYDRERAKALKKGRQLREWTDSANALAAVLASPPAGTRVVEADGTPTIIEP